MKKFIMIVCFVAWVCCIVFAIVPLVTTVPSTYEDQVVFYSEQTYLDFKQDVKGLIANDYLQVNTFDVIASEPPIIVKFSITVPHDYNFPYGENINHQADAFLIVSFSIVTSLVFLGVTASIMYPSKEGNEV